jgi:hypothetical protein
VVNEVVAEQLKQVQEKLAFKQGWRDTFVSSSARSVASLELPAREIADSEAKGGRDGAKVGCKKSWH